MGAGAAFQHVMGHAQNKFEAQRALLGTLRGEFSQEVATVKQYLTDARGAMGILCTNRT